MTLGRPADRPADFEREAAAWDGGLEPLLAVTRGDAVESLHRGVVALVDDTGRLLGGVGDPGVSVLLRSAAKPFQAFSLVDSGAADRWHLSDEELAVVCSSHTGSAEHLAHVTAILDRIGVDPGRLACGPRPPLDSASRRALGPGAEHGTRLHNTCSGKHAGMLALARHLGLDPSGYERPEHGVQRRILADVAGLAVHGEYGGTARTDAGSPCSAPAPGEGAALFAQLASGQDRSLRRIRDAMMAHPVLVAGEGLLDTDIMTALPGGVVAKGGAEGVLGLAFPATGSRRALGCLIKIEDGGVRPLRVLAARVLETLGESPAAAAILGPCGGLVTNTNGSIVGSLVALVAGGDLFREAERWPDPGPTPPGPLKDLRIVRGSGHELDVVRFLQRQWPRADQEILGRVCDWEMDRLVLVARRGHPVVGVLRAQLVGGVATVEELIVHEDHRGRGVGTQLLRSLEEQARARGLPQGDAPHSPRGARRGLLPAIGIRAGGLPSRLPFRLRLRRPGPPALTSG